MRVVSYIECQLDELSAQLLAFSVAQLPPSASAIIVLSAAAPIRGGALALFARVFAAGRRVRLRGLGEGHDGLLAVRPVLRRTEWDRQPGPEAASFAAHRAVAACRGSRRSSAATLGGAKAKA